MGFHFNFKISGTYDCELLIYIYIYVIFFKNFGKDDGGWGVLPERMDKGENFVVILSGLFDLAFTVGGLAVSVKVKKKGVKMEKGEKMKGKE